MPGFDVDAARKAGYSDDEILSHLTASRNFDVQGATRSGYSKADIISHLAGTPSPQQSPQPGPWASGYVSPPMDDGGPVQKRKDHNTGGLRGMTGRDSRDRETPIAGQLADLVEGTGKYGSGAVLPALVAAPAATIGGAVAGAVGQQVAQRGSQAMGASPETARLIGDVAAIPAAMAGARAVPAAGRAISAARTPNPDLMMGKALGPHPADTEFKNYIPSVRENMQRGAEITQQPIADVDSALAATKASMQEHMDALEPHKENARRVQAKMPTSVIKARQIEAIPKGLEVRDPQAYNDAIGEINAQFPGTPYLDTDQVFDQAILNNNQLAAFHSGKADAQSTKLITNSGDTAVLKAAGDAYRQWIAENLGPIAKGLNEDWGNLNGAKHYLENKVNPAFLQQPATPLAGAMENTGIHPGMHSIRHGLIQGVTGKIAGVPTGIDPMLESAFANTKPADPPWTPNVTPFRLSAAPDASGPTGYNPASVVDSPYSMHNRALPPAPPGRPINQSGPDLGTGSQYGDVLNPEILRESVAQRMGRAISQGQEQQ